MSLRAEIVRLTHFLLSAADALIEDVIGRLEQQIVELNIETERRRAERAAVGEQKETEADRQKRFDKEAVEDSWGEG